MDMFHCQYREQYGMQAEGCSCISVCVCDCQAQLLITSAWLYT